MKLLERDTVAEDHWTIAADDDALPDGAPVLVSLARFRRDAATLGGRNAPVGVVLEPVAAAEDLSDVAAHAALVSINFGKFRDGRGFTIARRLRERHGFIGTIRATGHVVADQHVFMRRCGVDEVLLRDDADPAPWRAALDRFHSAYQPAVIDEAPAHGLRRLRPGVA